MFEAILFIVCFIISSILVKTVINSFMQLIGASGYFFSSSKRFWTILVVAALLWCLIMDIVAG